MNLFEQETQPTQSYREIPLTRGQVALVDEDDYERLSQHTWHASWSKDMKSYYAKTNVRKDNGKFTTDQMSRMVMNVSRGDKRKVDHIEPSQTLDNRKANLRLANNSQNGWNCRISARNKSGFKGVHFNKRAKVWIACIRVNRRLVHLGSFKSAEEAASKRMEANPIYHGEFARGA